PLLLVTLPLTKWARGMFERGRKECHDDSEITEWVKAYGRKNNWASRQIYQVIQDNGIVLENRYRDVQLPVTGSYQPIAPLRIFKKIGLDRSGIYETDILGYLPT
ncbi:MAG: hypothetical protein ACRD8Z_08340, partial [Nitrososphaeraceae archaeon]